MEDPKYQDNWSSCVSQRTVRTFIDISTTMNRRPKQPDVIVAYLQAQMREIVFIRLQAEFSPLFITTLASMPNFLQK